MKKAMGWLRTMCARFKRYLKAMSGPRDSDDDSIFW